MALIPAKLTQKGVQAAVDGVTQFLGPQLSTLGGSGLESVASHDLAAPHEVFTLALSDVGKGLKGAKSTGWRYLVMSGDHAIAAAEVDRAAKGSKEDPTFSNLNTGGFVTSSLAALQAAEELPEVKQQDFQIRLLQIPALHAVALWLHGKSKELLLPLNSAEPEASGAGAPKAAQPIAPDEFFKSIDSQAKLIAQFDDTPEASRKQAKAAAKKAAPAKRSKPSEGSK